MVWSEAPTTGESRRQQLFPVAYRHRASSRLYLFDVSLQRSARSGAEGIASPFSLRTDDGRYWLKSRSVLTCLEARL